VYNLYRPYWAPYFQHPQHHCQCKHGRESLWIDLIDNNMHAFLDMKISCRKEAFFIKVELLSVSYLSIFRPDEGYSRNAPCTMHHTPCTLNYISTFSIKCKYYRYLIDQKLFKKKLICYHNYPSH
jgi:hypothetical protein